jgi:hypothetical protein
VTLGTIRDGTRWILTPTWTRAAGGSPRGLSGAMTSVSWPVRRRCSSTRSTELETPLTLGRNDSATIATRTQSDSHRPVSARLPAGIRQEAGCCRFSEQFASLGRNVSCVAEPSLRNRGSKRSRRQHRRGQQQEVGRPHDACAESALEKRMCFQIRMPLTAEPTVHLVVSVSSPRDRPVRCRDS